MSDKGIRVWLILAVCAAIVSTVALAVTAVNLSERINNSETTAEQYRTALENFYEENFYALMDSVNNMEVNLSKLAVTGSGETQQSLLSKLSMESAAAEGSANALPIYGENEMSGTVKFINQVGDYCLYLNRKLGNGEGISAEEKATLMQLYDIVVKLKENLGKLYDKIGYMSFTEIFSSEQADDFAVGEGFEMGESERPFEYPKLIYDGPFSDSKNDDGKVELTGEKYSAERLKTKLEALLEDMGVISVEYVCEIEGKYKVCSFDVKCGDESYNVHMTETGGYISQMNGYLMREDSDDEAVQMDAAQALDLSEAFAKKLGFDATPVWVSKTIDGYIYVNLCPVTENGVIIYPDLIKMTVDAVYGKIVGVEAESYLLNHKERSLAEITVQPEAAQAERDTSLSVEKVSLALIPVDEEEILCYEFKCSDGVNEYFVYINASTGKEEQIFRVIRGTEGYTVI